MATTSIVTPEHYEVVVKLPDTTARKYRVIAPDELVAIEHVQELNPDGVILSCDFRQLHHQWFEVVGA